MKQLAFLIPIVILYTITRFPCGVQSKTKPCERRYMRKIQGKCFYFSIQKLSWFGALNDCLRKGLVLADLSSPLEFYSVTSFLYSKGNIDDFWFSGNDLQTEGRFQYVSSGRLVRYFSNYSLLDPAESSDCDDCLEVRIRNDMIVVSDDNCQERQYFICSERYCDDAIVSLKKKQRHHSHEHLHHFHHDIGSDNDNDDNDYNMVGLEMPFNPTTPFFTSTPEDQSEPDFFTLESTTSETFSTMSTEFTRTPSEATNYYTMPTESTKSYTTSTESPKIVTTNNPSRDVGGLHGNYVTEGFTSHTKPPFVRRPTRNKNKLRRPNIHV